MAKDDWYREPCLTKSAREAFEERLTRTRSARPEYMRIQAGALAGGKRYGDAIALLDRIFADHPGHLEAWLYEDRADCHRKLGQIDEAIWDYCSSIKTMSEHPGVKGNAPLRLARLIVEE